PLFQPSSIAILSEPGDAVAGTLRRALAAAGFPGPVNDAGPADLGLVVGPGWSAERLAAAGLAAVIAIGDDAPLVTVPACHVGPGSRGLMVP
ncbi:hypothetical protein ABTM90_19515, partial [Acinetobacter baumannii]